MHLQSMRADMHAADLSLQQGHEWREHEDFRLLDVGFDIVDDIEGAEDILQRDRADHLDLGRKILTLNEIFSDTGAICRHQIAQNLISPSRRNDLFRITLTSVLFVCRDTVLRTGSR